MDSLLAEVLFGKGWTIYQRKTKGQNTTKKQQFKLQYACVSKEICNDKSTFKLKTQATDSLISLVVRHCYVLKSFFNRSNCESKSSQYLILKS